MMLVKIIKKTKEYGKRLVCRLPRLEAIASKPLTIPDFSGYNQPYHPSVLYLEKGFSGYCYWMVQSPYPIGGLPYRDRWECPCVYYSNDGIFWETNMRVNPIDDLNVDETCNGDFFSDPHLVYRDDTKMLECWYRITHMKKDGEEQYRYPTWIIRKKSSDGFNWSKREQLIDLQSKDSLDNMVRSPSVLWDKDKMRYKMWYVDTLPAFENRKIIHAESEDGVTWISKTVIQLDLYIDPWHIDVSFIKGIYHLILYTLSGSKGIYHYESNDGIDFRFKKELLKPSMVLINSFYRAGLYRSCSVEANDGIRVYFSANDGRKTHIGLLRGDCFEDLRLVSGGLR